MDRNSFGQITNLVALEHCLAELGWLCLLKGARESIRDQGLALVLSTNVLAWRATTGMRSSRILQGQKNTLNLNKLCRSKSGCSVSSWPLHTSFAGPSVHTSSSLWQRQKASSWWVLKLHQSRVPPQAKVGISHARPLGVAAAPFGRTAPPASGTT